MLKAAHRLCQDGHEPEAIKSFSPCNPVNDVWANQNPVAQLNQAAGSSAAFPAATDCHCLHAQRSRLFTLFPYRITQN